MVQQGGGTGGRGRGELGDSVDYLLASRVSIRKDNGTFHHSTVSPCNERHRWPGSNDCQCSPHQTPSQTVHWGIPNPVHFLSPIVCSVSTTALSSASVHSVPWLKLRAVCLCNTRTSTRQSFAILWIQYTIQPDLDDYVLLLLPSPTSRVPPVSSRRPSSSHNIRFSNGETLRLCSCFWTRPTSCCHPVASVIRRKRVDIRNGLRHLPSP